MALVVKEAAEKILMRFPSKHLKLAFAYGSGAFQQTGHKDMSKNMLDFMLVVDNPVEWHRENLKWHPDHYSFLRYFGAHSVAQVQTDFGAKVYFNTLVHMENRLVKYGVISTKSLLNDLYDWDTLYVSGRLHKPVVFFNEISDSELSNAMQSNLQSAVHSAFLQMPEAFSELDLFTTICGLSYSGDFRMKVGEDRNKISNIVKPNMSKFREMYSNILENSEHWDWNKSKGLFEQSLCHNSRYHSLNMLPKMVHYGLLSVQEVSKHSRDAEEVLWGLSHQSNCNEIVQDCIAAIVKKSSLTQSLKGIFTAGLSKSVQYSYSKVKKMLKSRSVPKS